MALQLINIGGQANDGTGDSIRDAFNKTNSNFGDVYTQLDVYNNIFSYVNTQTSAAKLDEILLEYAGFTATLALFQSDLNTNAQDVASFRTQISSFEGSITSSYNNLVLLVNSTLTSFATQITSLDSKFTNSITNAISDYNTKIGLLNNSTASLASQITNLDSKFSTSLTNAISSFNNSISLLNGSTSSLATQITNLDSKFSTSLTNAISSFNNSISLLSNSTSSLASQLATLTSTVNTQSTTITQFSQAINGIQGKYGVTIDNNGSVSGFQLISGAGGTSSFVVNADQFKLYTSGGTKNPFTVSGSTVTMQNVNITGDLVVDGSINGNKIGAYTISGANISTATITSANIATATITDANIANATISSAKIANLDANKINAGTITVGLRIESPDGKFIIDFANKYISITV